MEDSVEDWSRKVIAAQASSRSIKAIGKRVRNCARAVHVLLFALLCAAGSASAQNSVDAYQQSVLSIQQQIEANNFDDARKMIEEAQKKYPANGGLENLLGVIEIQQGHAELARQDFLAAIRHDPKLAGACLNLSRIDMQSAATDAAARTEARSLSERVLQLEHANDEAHYQLATIFGWEKNYQRSLDHLTKLSAQAQGEIGAEALRCADEAALGHREATTLAARALAANTDLTEEDADGCLPQLRAARRADLIEEILAAAANRKPLSAAGLRIVGLAQEAEGKLKDAQATLENAFAADSKSVAVLADLARVAEADGDHKGALEYLAHARDLAPADASLPYEFGVICWKMHLYEEARKALEAAAKLAPDNPEYNYGMGVVSSFGNDPADGIPYLEKSHSLRPRNADVIVALGTTYFRAKDYDNSQKWLKQAVANAKTAAEAEFYLGRIARLQGHFDEAIGDLERSLALRHDQPDVLAELGQIYVSNRDYPRAAQPLERAVQLDPDNYAANFGLLQLYARTGDARREEQSKHFEEIKDKKDEHDREMMRSIEFHKDEASP
jgi:tetratricopeptide (TPR) repeat protein